VDLPTAVEAARADARLTHPNPACQWSTAAYVVAIRHLILNRGDHEGAFQAAESVLAQESVGEVRGWLVDARRGALPAFHPQAGFVRIAFTHAFHHLARGTGYAEALAEVLAGGGDTDTNACIVGGLLGAAWGSEGVPEAMQAAVLGCDTTLGQPRPDWLHPRHGLARLPDLLAPGED
jgi:ADP-ribosylglycohydrolase